jgi:phosphate transport system protein
LKKPCYSFTNSDPDYAIWTIKNDSVVDEMNHKLLLGHLRKENIDDRTRSMVQSYIELKDMISNIERIADHATNIAEASIYSLQGTDIRHTGIGGRGMFSRLYQSAASAFGTPTIGEVPYPPVGGSGRQ